MSNNTFVSTRPSNPKSSHWLANNAISCSSESTGNVSFDFGPFGISASIANSNRFTLWADFSHAGYSRQWPTAGAPLNDESIVADPAIAWVSPYYIYYFQNCGSGTCSNTIQNGTTLRIEPDFDMTGMIFVDGLNSGEIAAMTNIGEVLAKTQVKSQWAFDQRSINNVVGYDVSDMVSIGVTPIITITGAANQPPDGSITLCADIDPATAGINNCPGS